MTLFVCIIILVDNFEGAETKPCPEQFARRPSNREIKRYFDHRIWVQNFSAPKEFLIKSSVIAPHVDLRGLEYS